MLECTGKPPKSRLVGSHWKNTTTYHFQYIITFTGSIGRNLDLYLLYSNCHNPKMQATKREGTSKQQQK